MEQWIFVLVFRKFSNLLLCCLLWESISANAGGLGMRYYNYIGGGYEMLRNEFVNLNHSKVVSTSKYEKGCAKILARFEIRGIYANIL